jgi:hypothetical protein
MPIAKSLRRDKEDVECCRRFLDDRNSLRDGEIMDLASRLRSRHIQSVVVQLISNELGWSSRTVVLFLSYADAKSGELVVNEMKEKGMPVGDLVLRPMTDFEGYICLYTISYLADDSLLGWGVRGTERVSGGSPMCGMRGAGLIRRATYGKQQWMPQ